MPHSIPQRHADELRSSVAASAGARAGCLGGLGMARVRTAPGPAAESRLLRGDYSGAGLAAHGGLRNQGCGGPVGRYIGQHYPAGSGQGKRPGDPGGARPRPPLDADYSLRPRYAQPSARRVSQQGLGSALHGGRGRAGTDLETAIRDGAASLPAGMVPRLLLVSDGNENLGSVARAIWQAKQLGIPVDTVPLGGHPKPGLLLESVAIPGQVFSGERFPIDVTVEVPGSATGSATGSG